MKRIKKHLSLLYVPVLLFGVAACATHLPEGDVLYTGQKAIQYRNVPQTKKDKKASESVALAVEEIDAALAKAPNGSFMGMSTLKFPFSLKLGIYNAFGHQEKGLGKWLTDHFGAAPVTMRTVNPDVRAKVATNLLHDYGMLKGKVNFQTFPHKKDTTKAKLQYTVDMGKLYYIDSLEYYRFPSSISNLLQQGRRRTVIKHGDPFTVLALDEERNRLSESLRNWGYYYFRPDFMTYKADTTLRSGGVSLRISPVAGIPPEAMQPYRLGKVSVTMMHQQGETPTDSVNKGGLVIRYSGKLQVRPGVIQRQLLLQEGRLYRQAVTKRTQERLTELGVFRYTDIRFTPADTATDCRVLNADVRAVYDQPYDAELSLNATTKSNGQLGPGAAFTVTKRNLFGGAENLTVGVKGSYEWQTRKVTGSSSVINSYELGLNSSLTVPGIVTFWKTYNVGAATNLRKDADANAYWKGVTGASASSSVKLYLDWLNRAGYYRMSAFGGEINYSYRPNRLERHDFTPIKLTYNVVSKKTAEFEQIMEENPALALSMRDQYIPAMIYTYTYDNSTARHIRHTLWWSVGVTSAGNVASALTALGGHSFKDEKKFMGTPFAQFLKLTGEIRRTWKLTPSGNHKLATRLGVGAVKAYGNSSTVPYSEQFYVGGANSIRAFTVRSVGPGSFIPNKDNTYGYMDQTGNLKLEANVEYRFPLFGSFFGAAFVDAGNVWTFRDDPKRPGSRIGDGSFFDQLALGTGLGVRYDLSMFVLRVDCGFGLHLPYDTGKKGYYNIPTFKDGFGLHFAIGYPF